MRHHNCVFMYLKKRKTTGYNGRQRERTGELVNNGRQCVITIVRSCIKKNQDNGIMLLETTETTGVKGDNARTQFMELCYWRQQETTGDHETTGDNGRQCENTIYGIM